MWELAMANVICEVLIEDRPLHRQAIVAGLLERGVTLGEITPLNRVTRILCGDERFAQVEGRFWTLSENCLNDLTAGVNYWVRDNIQNETAERFQLPAASTKREARSQMATKNTTTKRQVKTSRKSPSSSTTATLFAALGSDELDDNEIGRQQQGLIIAALSPIKKVKLGYSVKSQSGNGTYIVKLDGEDGPACSCPDFEIRDEPCKHIYAVEAYVMREESTAESPEWAEKAQEAEPVKRPTYKQNWKAYNAAQVKEQEKFGKLLRELCDTIHQPPQVMGRPRKLLSDMVFSVATKVYSTMSTRRAMGDVENARRDGQLDDTPCFSSIINYLQKAELTPLLVSLIEQSALPLRDVEEDFAVDSSGFGTRVYDRWFDEKWGRPIRASQWVKAHITCGVVSNIVTAVKVTKEKSPDPRQMPDMVETTAKNFTINEFSGDKAYLAHYNLAAVEAVGGTAYIPFKENSRATNPHHKKDPLWTKMYHYFHLNRSDFLAHYHKRSNVETAFWMIKSKFGASVRCKKPTAQVNEVLTKILCHNIVVLIQQMYELGIDPGWKEEVKVAAEVEAMEMEALLMAA